MSDNKYALALILNTYKLLISLKFTENTFHNFTPQTDIHIAFKFDQGQGRRFLYGHSQGAEESGITAAGLNNEGTMYLFGRDAFTKRIFAF